MQTGLPSSGLMVHTMHCSFRIRSLILPSITTRVQVTRMESHRIIRSCTSAVVYGMLFNHQSFYIRYRKGHQKTSLEIDRSKSFGPTMTRVCLQRKMQSRSLPKRRTISLKIFWNLRLQDSRILAAHLKGSEKEHVLLTVVMLESLDLYRYDWCHSQRHPRQRE